MASFPQRKQPPAFQQFVAQRVRRGRLQRGWTQQQLADRADLSRVTVHHLELGTTRHPRAATLNKVAAALEMPLEELCPESLPPLGATGSASATLRPAGLAAPTAASRAFDRATNRAVTALCNEQPQLFNGWTPEEWDELYSTFGAGGSLTPDGVKETAEWMNQRRETLRKLQIVLETHLGETAVRLIESLYESVRPADNLADTPQLAALLAEHHREK